jgi:hypothetical protein
MKTAMQELIERLKRNIKEMPNEVNSFTQGYKAGLDFVIECATTSLEKEKEQIIEAFEQGLEFGFPTNGSNYFNKTFNQNK